MMSATISWFFAVISAVITTLIFKLLNFFSTKIELNMFFTVLLISNIGYQILINQEKNRKGDEK